MSLVFFSRLFHRFSIFQETKTATKNYNNRKTRKQERTLDTVNAQERRPRNGSRTRSRTKQLINIKWVYPNIHSTNNLTHFNLISASIRGHKFLCVLGASRAKVHPRRRPTPQKAPPRFYSIQHNNNEPRHPWCTQVLVRGGHSGPDGTC